MPTFMMTSRHSPENCPMFNEKVKKMTQELMGKMPELAKKHGIKIAGSWTILPEHLFIAVYDAPTFEAFQKFLMEPDMIKSAGTSTTEIKQVMTTEEGMKLLK